jgi:hypothetical protein
VAGPDAATPAIVRTIQVSTTVRLCARTQRVSVDKETYLRSVCLQGDIITYLNG